MFDTIFEAAAQVLDFFYAIIPNYAIAIMLMTLLVMLVTTPLTLKGTRGMIKMQLLQPELKKIQEKHKGGDRQEMNAELMAFYQENELNPLGGCLPLLVQAPVFLLLFRLIRGLTRRTVEACGPEALAKGAEKCFDPQYLDEGAKLYQDLFGRTEMVSFGLDLSQSTSDALGESIVHGLPYLFLILLMIGAQYFQQKQVSARNPDGGMAMPQQKILLRVMPAFFGVISINFPAALVVYWVTSSVYRIGLQAYITKSLYGHDDAPGAKANKAASEARKKGKNDDDAGSGGTGSGETAAGDSGSSNGPAGGAKSGGASGSGRAGGNGNPGGKYQPSSKKKKKKRR